MKTSNLQKNKLRGHLSNIYRYKKVILRCKILDDNTFEVIHFHNLGDDGNGKKAMFELIEYAKSLGFEHIYLEVYHISGFSEYPQINEKLVKYYQEIGFYILNNVNNNISMVYDL